MPSCVWVRVPSLARNHEIEECSPVSFFMHASEVRENRSEPRGFVPLCHCVTSPEGERKRLPPFRSLARYQEIEEYVPGLFFCARETSSGQSLRASRPRTPLSLRDISRGRTETSTAVSVARTLSRGRLEHPRPILHHLVESSVKSCPGERGILRTNCVVYSICPD